MLETLEPGVNHDAEWKKLIHLWGSDFRTKTTNEKFYAFWEELGEALSQVKKRLKSLNQIPSELPAEIILRNPHSVPLDNVLVELRLRFEQGRFKDPPGLLLEDKEVLSQCENIQYYQDSSIRECLLVFHASPGAGEILKGKLLPKATLKPPVHTFLLNGSEIQIKTPGVEISLSANTGGDIRSLVFKGISETPLIQYLHPVYFDNIAYSNDYYSGWSQLCDEKGVVFHDTSPAQFLPDHSLYRIRIPVFFKQPFRDGFVLKRYNVYLNQPRVDMVNRFFMPFVSPTYFRTGIITLNPAAFNLETLGYSTTNGGKGFEHFRLKGKRVEHGRFPTQMCSSTSCLGATEGWLAVGDSEKGLAILTDKSRHYSIPMLEFKEIKSSWLLRIYNSIAESDDTGRISLLGHNEIGFTLMGYGTSLEPVRREASVFHHPVIAFQASGS